jgi:hypothetical protein
MKLIKCEQRRRLIYKGLVQDTKVKYLVMGRATDNTSQIRQARITKSEPFGDGPLLPASLIRLWTTSFAA